MGAHQISAGKQILRPGSVKLCKWSWIIDGFYLAFNVCMVFVSIVREYGALLLLMI